MGWIRYKFKFHLVSWSKICCPDFLGRAGGPKLAFVQPSPFGKVALALCEGDRGFMESRSRH